MSFDKTTRNRLAKFVADFRRLITDEFTEKFQSLYGISARGDVAALEKLTHLDEAGLATAALLRERIDYLVKTHPDDKDGTKAAVERLAREQAFTVLNRLAAIRMAEKRGLIVESVGRGYQSKGFKVFETVAGSALGDAYHRYRRYLFCLFDELAIDLGVLFDRHSPQGLLFPREPALLSLLDLLNAPDLESLWAEDETIGWIYQYYNDPAERKKMRDESAAPRNSRELAVRNQFFTPRYVVEFLTDNTLGRIWYEMTKGQTLLADQCRYMVRRPTEIFLAHGENPPESFELKTESLSQEELLQQPVHILNRPLKDPREIRLLDPACGSMHFGLYAFDLFEVIYEEAWDLAETHSELRPLTSDFSTKEEFLRQVPRLIIEHNIHGIDIDPRAVQIAGLSLWLRAQKAWQVQNVKAEDRPRVRRSNIVCAEPMPGSPEMLEEFTSSLQPPLLGELVKTVFDKMQLAGEAGSLLKIEEEIRSAIDTARKEWLKQQNDLLTRKDGSKEEFFETAEQQVIDALRAYAEQADADSYQRRLFADDAARGFAFIDLCHKRYDAIVMNPPFGSSPPQVTEYLKLQFPSSYYDIYTAFIDRFANALGSHGALGCITSKTFFSNSRLRTLRKWLLTSGGLTHCADLGQGVLDGATVETAASIISPGTNTRSVCFFDVTSTGRDEVLIGCVRGTNANVHRIQTTLLLNFPNQSFSAYWGSESLLSIFNRFPKLDPSFADTAAGQMTGDDFRFVRSRWETPVEASDKWFVFAKGGEFFRYYSDWPLLVDWTPSALIEYKKQTVRSVLISKNSTKFSARPALIWNRVNEIGFNVRAMPTGAKFADKAPAVFHKDHGLALLGVLCSRLMDRLCAIQNPNRMFEVRDVSSLPIPPTALEKVEPSVSRIIELKQTWASRSEPSSLYVAPWLFSPIPDNVRGATTALHSQAVCDTQELRELQAGIDTLVEDASGLGLSDKTLLESMLGDSPPESLLPDYGRDLIGCNQTWFCEAMLSFLLGTAFGRWDIRYATGECRPPELPDPFDPLPVCPPGMLQNAEGLPAEPKDVPGVYPLRISWPGILVDDENHPEDIVARVEDALKVIWKDQWEAIEQEACKILGVKTLREYFSKPAKFFADHLKRYSKSRRQAPIYWPLSTKSGSYTLWLYYHRLNDQTLHTCLADFLDPKIRKLQTELDAAQAGGSTRAAELREFLDELKDLHDEIERIIKLPWKPNLNDGVLITASPLWKLFRLPKWQKDLKACWEKLAKGDFDWAHIAHSIWPQRVEKACEKDRSIAIAHGLEHLCKIEPPKPKKKRGKQTEEEEAEEDDPQLIE